MKMKSSVFLKAERLDLKGAVTTQVGTWDNHRSSLAVDGNIRSYSVACIRCDANNPTDTIGWFRIDFNHDVDIAQVELINSHHYPGIYPVSKLLNCQFQQLNMFISLKS